MLRSNSGVRAYEMSVATSTIIRGASKTQQHQKDDTDINIIVKRFGVTGQVPQGVRAPSYADFGEEIFDYQSAMNALVLAQRSFAAMPAAVRKRFGNDPHLFVEFCSDPKNVEEMRKLGLAVEAAKPPEPQEVRVVNMPEAAKPA